MSSADRRSRLELPAVGKKMCSKKLRRERLWMDIDLVKTMIQQSLWEMYKKTGDEAYNDLYQKWYENYEKITINGLK
jgi:hypothetical protein